MMSPLTAKQKVTIWVAVITALGGIAAAIASGLIPSFLGSHSTKHISGTVSEAQSRQPMPGITVQLQTNDGRSLQRDTTDNGGSFSLPIPSDSSALRLIVTADGYVPYDEKLPAENARADIHLVRQHIQFGIPDGTRLDSAAQVVAGKLNVTVVFSRSCNKKAVSATLNGGQLDGDPRVPEVILRDLTQRVKDNTLRYDVTTIEAEKRYEVRCF